MTTITLRTEAESDITDAYRWYENKNPGLGQSFVQYVEDALSRIALNPRIYPCVHGDIRRAFTKRFPFGIFYVNSSNGVVVLAVMHVRKNPAHWQMRAR